LERLKKEIIGGESSRPQVDRAARIEEEVGIEGCGGGRRRRQERAELENPAIEDVAAPPSRDVN
jgi:hypothetical protein